MATITFRSSFLFKMAVASAVFFQFFSVALYVKYSTAKELSLPADLPNSYYHEFCVNNQILSFSNKACPGGVLLKEPMELTGDCRCINQHLKVYGPCSATAHNNYPTKVCRRNWNNEKKPLIVLVQPFKISNSWKAAHSSKCQRELASCAKLTGYKYPEENDDTIMKMKLLTINIDLHLNSESHHRIRHHNNHSRGHQHSHHQHSHSRVKRDMSIANIFDEAMQSRIQETINFLNELQFGTGDRQVHPKSMSLQALAKTVHIFNAIAPNVIVEDETLMGIFTLFMEKYSFLEQPGTSGNLAVDNFLDKLTFDEVMSKLEECSSKASQPNQEYEFISEEGSCPAYITHSVYRIDLGNYGTKKIKTELGKLMPNDRKYVPEEEDFILGTLWKVFDAVYSFCYPYTFTFHSAQIYFNYLTVIENIFSFPMVFDDFFTKNGQGTLMYASRIDHANLTLLMRNIESMDEAVHIVSKSKHFFLKPRSGSRGSGGEGGGGGGGEGDGVKPGPNPLDSHELIDDGTPSANPFNRNKRQKRSLQQDVDWSQLEIWGGRAYCLQLTDPSLPPSLFNTYPNIEDICSKSQFYKV